MGGKNVYCKYVTSLLDKKCFKVIHRINIILKCTLEEYDTLIIVHLIVFNRCKGVTLYNRLEVTKNRSIRDRCIPSDLP